MKIYIISVPFDINKIRHNHGNICVEAPRGKKIITPPSITNQAHLIYTCGFITYLIKKKELRENNKFRKKIIYEA